MTATLRTATERDAGVGVGVDAPTDHAVVVEALTRHYGGHDITDVGLLPCCNRCRNVGVEVAGADAGRLDGVVDGVDVVVRGCDHGDGAAVFVVVDPGGGDVVEVLVEGAPSGTVRPSRASFS